MTIDPNTLFDIKNNLLQEKAELEKNLNRIAKPIDAEKGDYETTFDEVGNDREDNATEVEEYADNLPVEITLEKKLQDVIVALAKLEDGSFGVCEKCGKEIDIERLKVNPSAKMCITCN